MSEMVDVGGVRARVTADISNYASAMDQAKAKARELGEQSKKAAADIKTMGDSGEKIAHLSASLENVNAKIELQRRKLAELKKQYAETFNAADRTKLEQQILNVEANLLRLIKVSDSTAARLNALDDAAENAGKGLSSFDDNLKAIGLSTEQISKVSKALGTVNARPTEAQLRAVRDELVRVGASADQIEKVERELKGVTEEAEKTKAGINGLSAGLSALGAGAAASKIVDTIKTLAEEANQLNMSYRGVYAVAKSTNNSVEDSVGLVEELSERWSLNRATVADTVKTYLSAGLTLEETKNMMIATADAAAYNREAHYTLEQAMLQTARGIKQGNSNLTDAAGITTNLSVMYDRFAKTLGTTAGKLTETGKIQAAYNGMMAEAAMFAGNADEAMAGYAGTQATFNSTIEQARTEIGGAFLPILQDLLDGITPLIKGTAEWATENKDIAVGIGAASLAFTSFIAVVGALSAAFIVLKSAMGGVGLLLTLVGAVAAGVTAYGVAADKAAGQVLRLAQSQEELNAKMADSLSWTSNDLKNARADIEELRDILSEREKLQKKMEELQAKLPDYSKVKAGSAVTIDQELAKEINKVQQEIDALDKSLRKMDFETPEEAAKAIEHLREASEGAVNAILQEQDATFQLAATNNERLKTLEASLETYKSLTAQQELDAAQKAELRTATQSLTSAYPGLHAMMDEEGNLRIENIDLAETQMGAERDMLDATLDYENQRLESLRRTTEEQKKSVEAQIENYKALMQTMLDVINADNATSNIDSLNAEKLSIRNGKNLDELYVDQNRIQSALNEINERQAKLKGGNIPGSGSGGGSALFDPGKEKEKKPKKEKKTKSAAELAAEARKKAYDADLATIRFQAEMFDWSTDKQIKAYERLRKTHERHLKDTVDDRRTLDLQVKRLNEDTVKSQFDFSAEWIKQEERRMELSGKSENEIANMKLKAWTRVRDRYAADSEFYKRADDQVYQARKALMDKTVKLAEDSVKVQKASIESVKKAELDAIKKRKEAALADYDARIKAIDELIAKEAEYNSDVDHETALREKNARIDELASAVGPEGIAEREQAIKDRDRMILEHERELRKRELESQKGAIQDEKNARSDAFDTEIAETEAQFDKLIDAFNSYSGDIKMIEAVLAEFRVSEAGKANAAILEELDSFVSQYNAKMAQVETLRTADELAEYNANKDAWAAAKARGDTAEMARLNVRNQAIRDKYGILEDSGQKLQSFAVGGIVRGANGEPVIAQVHAGEMVLNARQQAVLFDALQGAASRTVSQPGGAVTTTTITNHYDLGVDEVVLEDRADIRGFFDERARFAQRTQNRGDKAI
ncbi:hypothetical protein [Paenibacillus aceti]|uniref:Phage tail tape measure protein n=1 Tax=Paenibacillus aceti TaxID=1820010 RepID=A0ABQ1W5B5_9BACL|nr:hypothetical protein [Paenibacillus aceti]GGG15783.1 hypothetical protein GCM10010913_42220 [Paenibacillus aceti]